MTHKFSKFLLFIILLIFFAFVVSLWSEVSARELSRGKIENGQVQGGVMGGVAGRTSDQVQGGVMGGVDRDYDLNMDSVKMIDLNIKILEVFPTQTILRLNPQMSITNGDKASLVFGSQKPPRSKRKFDAERVTITIKPLIIPKRGIELTISSDILYPKKELITFNKKVMTSNYEEVIITLFDNKEASKKLVARITPYIKTIPGAMNYPGKIGIELGLKASRLMMNKKQLCFTDYLGGNTDSTVGNVYLNCFVQDRGLYVIAVRPFTGAQKVGVVNDKMMTFKFNKDQFLIDSSRPILSTPGKWIVYGRQIKNLKGSKYIKRLLNLEEGEGLKKRLNAGNWISVFVTSSDEDFFK